MLFDAHTHLNFEEYSPEERAELAAEIEASDVSYIIDVGDRVESSIQAIQDAQDYGWCYAAVGIHPEHASVAMDEDIEEIKKLAMANRALAFGGKDGIAESEESEKIGGKVVAIGEIGLDFYYGKDDKEEQIELFRKQIRLANELKMPIMIHTRDADQLTMDILKEEGAFSNERKSWFPRRKISLKSAEALGMKDGISGVTVDANGDVNVDANEKVAYVPDARVQMHCYSGSAEMAVQYAKLGATISLGGPVTFKNGRRAVEVVQKLPIEYIMSETDAPYMAPVPMRGRPNKSPYIEHVVRRMALIKGLEYEEAAAILMENGKRFFGLLGIED